MVTALKQIGFDYVFDTDFAADLTIMEEGSEFMQRFTHRDRYTLAHVHLLLPGLGAVCKEPVPPVHGQPLHRQEPPADVRRGGQELLRRKDRA